MKLSYFLEALSFSVQKRNSALNHEPCQKYKKPKIRELWKKWHFLFSDFYNFIDSFVSTLQNV